MPKIWTWLVLLVGTASAVTLVDLLTGPERASAQAGASLSEPIPEVLAKDRRGTTQNMIGWTHAKKRYQADMPIGRDILVGWVEAAFRGGFMPKGGHGRLPATGFVAESEVPAVSGHATNVAVQAFGTDSAGLGVREVRCWELNDWLGGKYLRTGTTVAPDEHPARVFNHAWIGSGGRRAPLVLRRVDYVVDAYDKVMVCGVNNGRGAVPAMLASAYNVVSVGKISGNNSDGLTTVEGEGRCKPELVAPGGTTSGATGVVTGCVAALLELADRKAAAAQDSEGGDRNAVRSEVVKAALLAGAWRQARWAPPEGEPLDRSLGAGVVDLDRSLAILDGGHVEPDRGADTTHRYGWSFAPIQAGQTRTYTFTVDSPQREAGFALTWHRRVLGGVAKLTNNDTGEERMIWNSGHFTPNLDLELVRHTDGPGGEGGTEPVAVSASEVDNVELIHLGHPEGLDPGRYTLRVTRAADDTGMAWDYALAWRIEAPWQ